jgi:hypothetical protein
MIEKLQGELEAEITKRQAELHVRLERGKVVFDAEVRQRHRELRVGFWKFMARTRPQVLIVAPFTYSLIVPLVLLDIFVSVYQAVCFPLFGIDKVRRSEHLVFDRHHLGYLNALQKFNCVYCSYANGLIGFAREVAGRTEQYWCPIKHARRVAGVHANYVNFSDFGDGESYHEEVENLRHKLRGEKNR